MTDWNALKTRYASGTMSYKALAEEYGICYQTLYEHGRMEHWGEARKAHREKTVRKSLDRIGDRQAENLARVDALADELLQKLGRAIDELDLAVTRCREKGEDESGVQWQREFETAEPGGRIDRQGLRQLAASLRDLKEIKALQSELDRLEQEARIERLKKAAADPEDPGTLEVVLQEDLREFGR